MTPPSSSRSDPGTDGVNPRRYHGGPTAVVVPTMGSLGGNAAAPAHGDALYTPRPGDSGRGAYHGSTVNDGPEVPSAGISISPGHAGETFQTTSTTTAATEVAHSRPVTARMTGPTAAESPPFYCRKPRRRWSAATSTPGGEARRGHPSHPHNRNRPVTVSTTQYFDSSGLLLATKRATTADIRAASRGLSDNAADTGATPTAYASMAGCRRSAEGGARGSPRPWTSGTTNCNRRKNPSRHSLVEADQQKFGDMLASRPLTATATCRAACSSANENYGLHGNNRARGKRGPVILASPRPEASAGDERVEDTHSQRIGNDSGVTTADVGHDPVRPNRNRSPQYGNPERGERLKEGENYQLARPPGKKTGGNSHPDACRHYTGGGDRPTIPDRSQVSLASVRRTTVTGVATSVHRASSEVQLNNQAEVSYIPPPALHEHRNADIRTWKAVPATAVVVDSYSGSKSNTFRPARPTSAPPLRASGSFYSRTIDVSGSSGCPHGRVPHDEPDQTRHRMVEDGNSTRNRTSSPPTGDRSTTSSSTGGGGHKRDREGSATTLPTRPQSARTARSSPDDRIPLSQSATRQGSSTLGYCRPQCNNTQASRPDVRAEDDFFRHASLQNSPSSSSSPPVVLSRYTFSGMSETRQNSTPSSPSRPPSAHPRRPTEWCGTGNTAATGGGGLVAGKRAGPTPREFAKWEVSATAKGEKWMLPSREEVVQWSRNMDTMLRDRAKTTEGGAMITINGHERFVDGAGGM